MFYLSFSALILAGAALAAPVTTTSVTPSSPAPSSASAYHYYSLLTVNPEDERVHLHELAINSDGNVTINPDDHGFYFATNEYGDDIVLHSGLSSVVAHFSVSDHNELIAVDYSQTGGNVEVTNQHLLHYTEYTNFTVCLDNKHVQLFSDYPADLDCLDWIGVTINATEINVNGVEGLPKAPSQVKG